jgi:glucose-1-phosphate cytidylyltransferase
MKSIILSGGLGTRLGEYTELIPKPMVHIGTRPILWHIMKIYSKYGYNDFFLALGYKGEVIKDYFLNYRTLNSDFSINLNSGNINSFKSEKLKWKVTMVDTGLNTMTGGRLKRMKQYLGNKTFLLTYGDGVSDINIKKLVSFHKKNKKMITMTAVRPPARFGELELDGPNVRRFVEKPQLYQGWINGGFLVCEPEIFELIEDDQTLLEREPLEKAAKAGELMAYRHEGFWQCMDTKRDHDLLQELWAKGAPWDA